MNVIQSRIEIANLHGGGMVMTTLILLFGDRTPRVLRAFATLMAYILGRMGVRPQGPAESHAADLFSQRNAPEGSIGEK